MIVLPTALLPETVGRGWIDEARPQAGTVRAHLHDGRTAQCIPVGSAKLAIDAESLRAPAAKELADRHGLSVRDFLTLWTRAEVLAKLSDVPSLQAFRQPAAKGPALSIRTEAFDDLVVSVGWYGG